MYKYLILAALFFAGCEKKAEPCLFHHKEEIRVTSGFYKGNTLVVNDRYNTVGGSLRYRVSLGGQEFNVSQTELLEWSLEGENSEDDG